MTGWPVPGRGCPRDRPPIGEGPLARTPQPTPVGGLLTPSPACAPGPTGVCPQVAREGVPPAAGIVAEVALEGLLPRVQLDVPQQVALLREGGPALVALEGPLSWGETGRGERGRPGARGAPCQEVGSHGRRLPPAAGLMGHEAFRRGLAAP